MEAICLIGRKKTNRQELFLEKKIHPVKRFIRANWKKKSFGTEKLDWKFWFKRKKLFSFVLDFKIVKFFLKKRITQGDFDQKKKLKRKTVKVRFLNKKPRKNPCWAKKKGFNSLKEKNYFPFLGK